MSWTDHQVEALRGYLSENGVTFKEATASLNKEFGTGYSRNSVISKCGREKIISKNGAHVHGMVRSKEARPAKRRRNRGERPAIMPETTPLRSVPVEPLHISLHQLNDQTCKWPYGETAPFTYCGNAVFAGSYCGAHHFLSRRNRE